MVVYKCECKMSTSMKSNFNVVFCFYLFNLIIYLVQLCQTVQRQLDKDSKKIYPTEFMFTDRKELKINHNEVPGWIIATESSKKV